MTKRIVIAAIAVACSLGAEAQQRVALRDGVIVHPTESTAYVMLPQGGVGAVDLVTGAMRWTSTAADKPLAVVGKLVVSQVEPRSAEARNRLELVALDATKRGAVKVRKAAELPEHVYAATAENLEGRFVATARADGRNAIVTWSWKPMPIRGAAPPSDEQLRPGARMAEVTGMVTMNLASGRMTDSTVAPGGLIPAASSTWILSANQRIAAAPAGQQYESADGKHVLQSERVADESVFEKYRWTLFNRATGARLGETRSHIAFAPFVVRGGILVFDTTPFGHRSRRGVATEEPAKLRGVHLASGAERWSVPIREVGYRGPLPP